MFLAPIHIPKLAKSPEKISNSSIVKKFPIKFWRLVNSCQSNAVCWGFGGNSVRILKEKFEYEFLNGDNKPFKTATFSSFIRQLNLYGFRKVVRPVITNEHGQKLNTSLIEYRHPLFLKGHPELLPRIKRNNKSMKFEKNRKSAAPSTVKVIFKRKTEDVENEVEETANQREAKERRSDPGVVLRDVSNQPETPPASNSVPVLPSPVSTSCDASTSTSPRKIDSAPELVHSGLQDLPNNRSQQNRLPLNLSEKNTENSQSVDQLSVEVNTAADGENQLRTENVSSDVCHDTIKTEHTESKLPGCTSTVSADGSLQTVTIIHSRNGTGKTTPQIDACKNGNVTEGPVDNSTKPRPTPAAHIPAVKKTLHRILMRRPAKGQSVLYLNPRSASSRQATTQNRPLRLKPVHVRPQPVMVYNIPRSVSQTPGHVPPMDSALSSATCEEVASHPLLQPVRKEYVYVPWGLKDSTYATKIQPVQMLSKQQLVSNSFNQLASIPETDQTSVLTESPDQDVLSNLPLFRLSSALKDIDAPTSMAVPNQRVESVPQSVTESQLHRDETSTTDIPSCNKPGDNSPDATTEKTISASDKSIEVQLIDRSRSAIDDPGDDMQTPRMTGPQSDDMTVTNASKCSGPRRELFKEKITRRITIPLSGLPQDLFSQGVAGSDKHRAVVTIETLEDGRITGHLILPGKEIMKNIAE